MEVSKRTIQKYMPKDRKSHVSSQSWATFLKNQAGVIWACDFTVMHDWLFRSWYIFVVLDLKTRQIVHTGVTKYPTDDWSAYSRTVCSVKVKANQRTHRHEGDPWWIAS